MSLGHCRGASFVNTIDPARPGALRIRPEGAQCLRFQADPGLYQLSAVLDAREFDWESLYEDLTDYGNTGQRTGPWDFKLGPSTPLVPAYWVALDGERLGLWYFQRVSIPDIAQRVFRGRTAFQVSQPGEHELCLKPYREMKVRWLSAALEVDPEDHLAPLPQSLRTAPGSVPAAAWTDPAFWEERRRRLATTHRLYAGPLRAALDWACSHGTETDVRLLPTLDIPLLVAAHYLDGRAGALEMALRCVDEAIAMPHWGNPKEDGYGHDGDMGPALLLRALAWAWHMIGSEMGDERRQRLLDKLVFQGNRFFDLALLNRDYWGGSLLQDHGWRSLWAFGTAALHLYGVAPDAERWLRFALPRLQRSLDAMPEDGVVPPSSHKSPWLYLFDPTQFRDALIALGGPDILDAAPFRPVVEYLERFHCPRDHERRPVPTNARELMGPAAFLARIASKYGDARAAWLHREMLVCADVAPLPAHLNTATAHGLLWGFLAHESGVEPPAVEDVAPRPRRQFSFFKDSALAHFHDAGDGATLALQCGPPNGYRAYRNAPGPCDRLAMTCHAGHFAFSMGQKPLLASPGGGYRLHTFLGNVLLVDGRGQRDDVGYPMSIPSWRDTGAEILHAHWDETTGTGRVRLNLQPAYPDDLGMLLYRRDLILTAGRQILCRDRVAFAEPRRLAWLFHARRDVGLTCVGGLRYRFGSEPCLWLEPLANGVPLVASVHQTDVVYSYTKEKPKFDHVRYETEDGVTAATVDFVIDW